MGDSEINITQRPVLKCIARRPGEPLAHVADELEMERTSLYRAIAPMVRDGWLALTDGPDARSRTAKLTRKGEQLLAKSDTAWEEVQDRVIESFGRAKWLALVSELNRLADCAEPPKEP